MNAILETRNAENEEKGMACKVFLALPTYDGSRNNGIAIHAAAGKVVKVVEVGSSLLAYGFNRLWCEALNCRKSHGVTHFMMMHADVRPLRPDFVEKLLTECESADVDIMSAIVPIKSDQGLTSTGKESGDFWNPRRFTMKEIFAMPETFTGDSLLVNTGLFVCRFGAWAEQICFSMLDRIEKGPDGKWRAMVVPEDWHFSRQAHRLGLKVAATRKIPLVHVGNHNHANTSPWGTAETDPAQRREQL